MSEISRSPEPLANEDLGDLRSWEQTFHAAPIGIAHVGADGRWLRVNPQVRSMLGYSEQELMRLTFQDLTHPEDLNKDVDLAGKVLKGELDRYKMQKRYFHKDGHIIWANLTVAAVRNAKGDFVHFVSVLEDISEMKRMHEALEDSEARFRAVQETSPDGFMTFESVRDTTGRIIDFRWTYINAAAETMVGRKVDDLLGKRLLEEMPGNREEGLFDAYVQVVETGKTWLSEFEYDQDGVSAWFRATAARAGDGFAVSFADISDHKRGEIHREMLLRELSHRVKNMLATVQAMASHTLRSASDFESFRSAFQGRLKAIARCHDLLVATDHTRVDMRALVESQVKPLARGDDAAIVMQGTPLVLTGEAAHAFGLVLHELATNAVKYGALSNQDGKIIISWIMTEDEGKHWIDIAWVESGGPPVTPPSHQGFGTLLIEQSLSHSVGGRSFVSYAETGLVARFRLPQNAAR